MDIRDWWRAITKSRKDGAADPKEARLQRAEAATEEREQSMEMLRKRAETLMRTYHHK